MVSKIWDWWHTDREPAEKNRVCLLHFSHLSHCHALNHPVHVCASICFMSVCIVLSRMCMLRGGFHGCELWFLMLQNKRTEDSDTHKYTTGRLTAPTEIGKERQKEEGPVNWRSSFIWLISCFFPEAQREKENLVSEMISAAWLSPKMLYRRSFVWIHRIKLVSHLQL